MTTDSCAPRATSAMQRRHYAVRPARRRTAHRSARVQPRSAHSLIDVQEHQKRAWTGGHKTDCKVRSLAHSSLSPCTRRRAGHRHPARLELHRLGSAHQGERARGALPLRRAHRARRHRPRHRTRAPPCPRASPHSLCDRPVVARAKSSKPYGPATAISSAPCAQHPAHVLPTSLGAQIMILAAIEPVPAP